MDKKTPKTPPDDPTRELLIEHARSHPEGPASGAAAGPGRERRRRAWRAVSPDTRCSSAHSRQLHPARTVVPRGLPKFFAGDQQPKIAEGSGRRELANWVASRDNPLTARVIVNRVWQGHFGRGLVPRQQFRDALGAAIAPGTARLAGGEVRRRRLVLKKLHRRILLSATYQQASVVDRAVLARDPENRWLGRFTPRRLEAEAIRDAMLFVTGRLDPARAVRRHTT